LWLVLKPCKKRLLATVLDNPPDPSKQYRWYMARYFYSTWPNHQKTDAFTSITLNQEMLSQEGEEEKIHCSPAKNE